MFKRDRDLGDYSARSSERPVLWTTSRLPFPPKQRTTVEIPLYFENFIAESTVMKEDWPFEFDQSDR